MGNLSLRLLWSFSSQPIVILQSIFDLAGEEKLGLFVYWLNKRLLFLLLLLLLHYIFTTTFTTTNLRSTSYGLGNRIWGSQLSRYNSKSINCYRKQQILHQLLLKKAKSNAQPNFLHHVSSKTLPYLSYTLAGNVSWRSTFFVSTDSKVTSLWSTFHTTTSNFLEAIIT